jgi:hypothetical protein
MGELKLEQSLEICLERLDAGALLEDVLTDFPDQVLELRPLLETALDLRQLSISFAPQIAENCSRSQFLTAAAALPPVPHRRIFDLFPLRFATSLVITFGIFAAVLLGAGFASAASLPGDVFYPVKRVVEQVQVDLVQDPSARMKLEEDLDERRAGEVSELNERHRRQSVAFSGFLQKTTTGQWQVNNLALKLPEDSPSLKGLEGVYVEVSGYSDDKVVEVEHIQQRNFQWSGPLQKVDGQIWVIGGIQLLVDEKTQLSGAAYLGALVRVTAIRLQNQYLALQVDISVTATSVAEEKRTPTQSPRYASPSPKASSTEREHDNPSPTVQPSPSETKRERESSPTPRPSEVSTKQGQDHDKTVTPRPSAQSTGQSHSSPTIKSSEIKAPSKTSSSHD